MMYTTKFQYRRLEKIIKELEEMAHESSKETGKAAELGDIIESCEFESASRNERILYIQLNELYKQLSYQIVDNFPMEVNHVMLGTKVKIQDIETGEILFFNIVGAGIIYTELGEVSYLSPIGKNLLGAKVGDIKEIKIPAGIKKYKILNIEEYTHKKIRKNI